MLIAFPNFREHIEQFRKIFEADDTFLNEITEQVLAKLENNQSLSVHWTITLIEEQPLAIQRRVFAAALRKRNIEVTFERIQAILDLLESAAQQGQPGAKGWLGALTLNENWQIKLTQQELCWIETTSQRPTQLISLPVKIPGNTIALLSGRVLQIHPVVNNQTNNVRDNFPSATAAEALVNLNHVKPPLVLRSRSAEDCIRPFGMNEKVRLKKYLHTHKRGVQGELLNPPELVLADQEEVLWVPGIGISNKIRVTDSPSHLLKWLPLSQDDSCLA